MGNSQKRHALYAVLFARASFALALALAVADTRLVQLFTFFQLKLHQGEAALRRPERVSPADFAAYLAVRWLNDISDFVPVHRRYADIVRQVGRDISVLLVVFLPAYRSKT